MRRMTLAPSISGLIMTLLLSSPAAADSINLSLANATQAAGPGSTLSFIATVSAPITNTAAVFLNADPNSEDYPLTLDDSGFLFSFPLSLSPGSSFTGTLFTVSLPAFAATGVTYNGYFEIDGGADSSASNNLASVTFQVTSTPEPRSVILLLAGLSGLAVPLRRKHRSQLT
jgi:hypothetical protein